MIKITHNYYLFLGLVALCYKLTEVTEEEETGAFGDIKRHEEAVL